MNALRRRLLPLALATVLPFSATSVAHAFCGFYVARADSKLFNEASQVALVRDGDRTVLTMANDYQGELKEFAVVIPVPQILQREQIHVAEPALIAHLDAYTAPRLVEYFDGNPCSPPREMLKVGAAAPQSMPAPAAAEASADRLGVKIEAQYTVGEYDILILSAKESGGLVTWLKGNGYRLPPGAEPVVESYLKQGLYFFVARVNLKEQVKLGNSFLRPLQVAYESPKFMLPIRLGTVNANGPQELFIYALTRKGRVETTNYRTVRLATDANLPEFVEAEFPRFYRDMFRRQVDREGKRAVFLEYAWDMAWCDPCAADPLSREELQELGVFWLDGGGDTLSRRPVPGGGAQDVFVTRLHVRYDRENFPSDLMFQETGDRTNFQGRFILQHPWKGSPNACPAAREYFRQLPIRLEKEAQTLANLTGWDIQEIRGKLNLPKAEEPEKPWWKKLWGDG